MPVDFQVALFSDSIPSLLEDQSGWDVCDRASPYQLSGTGLNLGPCLPIELVSQPQQELLIMASKPEKRVASSVFITLAPPRRDVAVTEEVGQAACEARRARPWETPAPTKTPGAGLSRKPNTWTPSGRISASIPAAPPQLANGGCCPPPPSLSDEDLDLLPPPPPPPSAYLALPEEEPPALMGSSLISDLEQLH
ncbi:filamin-binding LIM protein 1-like, partial [Cricetulus griseus]|uniref:filamin-binding LIM protein 1-like n=1 Tax=Cricetulus griseus TaxID=10029 RepID=UPI0004547553